MRMTECSGLMRKKRYKVGNEGGGFRGYVYCVSRFIFICVRIVIGRKNKRTKQGLGTRDRKSGQGSLTVTNGVFPFCPSGCANHIPNTYLSHTKHLPISYQSLLWWTGSRVSVKTTETRHLTSQHFNPRHLTPTLEFFKIWVRVHKCGPHVE